MTFNTKTISYRFPLWLTVIFFTLFSIPILVFTQNMILAKIAGFLTVILTTVAIRLWMRIARQKTGVIDKVPLSKNDIFDLKRVFPFFNSLSNAEIVEYKDKIGIVLSKVKFIDENGEHYSKLDSIKLAFYILIIKQSNIIDIKACVIVNSIQENVNLSETVISLFYPIKDLIDENSICRLNFSDMMQHEKLVALVLFLSKIKD